MITVFTVAIGLIGGLVMAAWMLRDAVAMRNFDRDLARWSGEVRQAKHRVIASLANPSAPIPCISFDSATGSLGPQRCPTFHADTVPVELLATGETVAALCLDCDEQLPAEWLPRRTALPKFVPDPRLTLGISE